MTLKEYLKSNHLTQDYFSILIKRSQSYVSNICSGKRIPKKKDMLLIMGITGNLVCPEDYYRQLDDGIIMPTGDAI